MEKNYTTRIVEEDGKLIAYIDINGEPVIGQPGLPGQNTWSSREEAEAWLTQHVENLISYDAQAEAARLEAETAKAEQDALILQAKEDSVKIEQIYQMLSQLSNPSN
jgi:hypothetical protein